MFCKEESNVIQDSSNYLIDDPMQDSTNYLMDDLMQDSSISWMP